MTQDHQAKDDLMLVVAVCLLFITVWSVVFGGVDLQAILDTTIYHHKVRWGIL